MEDNCIVGIREYCGWQPYQYFSPGEAHGQRSWRATVHRVAKSQTRLKQLGTHACTLWISKKICLTNRSGSSSSFT